MRIRISDLDEENIKGVTVDSLQDLHGHAHKTATRGDLDREQVEQLHSLCAAEMKRRQVDHDCPLEFPFPRGLYLAPPHGQLIYDGRKTAIARPYPDRNVEGEFVILSGEFAYGVAQIGCGEKVTLDQFDEQFEAHRCRSTERMEWWPDVKSLWVYSIESFDPYIAPRLLTFSPGSMIVDHVQFVESEKQHSRDRCMACKEAPKVDVQWADGRGRAWFCTKCFRDWAKKEKRDIIKTWWVPNGQTALCKTEFPFIHTAILAL